MLQMFLLRSFSATRGVGSVSKLAVVAALSVALSQSTVLAEAFLYEGFDYASGSTLGGQGTGTGFGSNVWTGIDGGSITGGTIGAGLSYNDGTNDLQTSGGHYRHFRMDGSSSLYRVHRKFDMASISASNPDVTFEDTTTYTPGHHIGKDGSTVWFSFLYQSAWDGATNGGGENNWGGVSLQDGDANQNGAVDGNSSTFVRLEPDPTDPDFPTDVRTLRAYDGRGDLAGEKNGQQEFALTAHNSKTVFDELGGPLANDSPPTFVLLRMDFRGDPSDPNATNEYYETWPNSLDQADQVRMWLNPSLSSEPALGTENALLDYEGFFGREDDGEFKIYADRFDLKFDGFYFNARADGTVYDELRIGTTFGDVAPIAGSGGTEPGDYDASGAVGQGDLDLVLLNWGNTAPPIPAGWVNEQPSGLIGQGNLDGVLLNWGNGSSTVAGVPEPTSMALALLGLCGVAASRRKRS